MTWSLALKNGDLSLGSSHGFETVTNEQKLVQDLRCNFLQKAGSDPLHPEFGSVIDGGVLPNGTVHNGFIGNMNDEVTKLQIQSEINRVVEGYQERTLARAKADKMIHGRASLSRGEVLYNLNDITIQDYFDQLNITINFTTASDTNQTLEITI